MKALLPGGRGHETRPSGAIEPPGGHHGDRRYGRAGAGRPHIEKINGPFLFKDRGSPAEYGAGMKLCIERGWLSMHDSGTFVRFTSEFRLAAEEATALSRDLRVLRRRAGCPRRSSNVLLRLAF
jgi:hypothetical protein